MEEKTSPSRRTGAKAAKKMSKQSKAFRCDAANDEADANAEWDALRGSSGACEEGEISVSSDPAAQRILSGFRMRVFHSPCSIESLKYPKLLVVSDIEMLLSQQLDEYARC